MASRYSAMASSSLALVLEGVAEVVSGSWRSSFLNRMALRYAAMASSNWPVFMQSMPRPLRESG